MYDLFWNIFELTVNLLQGVMFAYFMCGCLEIKHFKTLKIIPYSVCTLLIFASITFFNYISYYEGVAIFIYFLILFLFSLAFLEGSSYKKIFLSAVPVNAMAVGSIFSTNLMSFIVNLPIYEFMSKSTLLRLITVAVSNFILFSIIFIIKKTTTKNQSTLKLKEAEWVLLAFDLILSVIAYMFLYYSIYSSTSIQANFFSALCVVVIVVINITMYILLGNFSNRYKIQMENSLLRQQTEYQEETIRETKKQYDELQKLKHDFDNFIAVIKNLNEDNKGKEIDEYINGYLKTQTKFVRMIKTGNNFIDAILNSKLTEAKKHNIEVNISVLTNLGKEAHIDLCNLLGNLFDNAIRACDNCKQKSIQLDISKDGEGLCIFMKNSVDCSVLKINPELKSDKHDKINHGYGTKIIRDIAAKYEGFVDFYEENNFFCCNIHLYV